MKIDALRAEYKRVTKDDPAIRWNKQTLEKKILDAEILQAGHAAIEKTKSPPDTDGDIKPEFESLATEKSKSEAAASEQPRQERRGGLREGAGRPTGQSDERARCERLLSLEVPDLAIKKILQGMNLALGRFTLAAFSPGQIDSLALGLTLPIYYWFPSLEGGLTNKWTLHFQSLELIGRPVAERMQLINQIIQQAKEKENGNKNANENIEQKKAEVPVNSPGGESAAQKRSPRPRSKKKQRPR